METVEFRAPKITKTVGTLKIKKKIYGEMVIKPEKSGQERPLWLLS